MFKTYLSVFNILPNRTALALLTFIFVQVVPPKPKSKNQIHSGQTILQIHIRLACWLAVRWLVIIFSTFLMLFHQ